MRGADIKVFLQLFFMMYADLLSLKIQWKNPDLFWFFEDAVTCGVGFLISFFMFFFGRDLKEELDRQWQCSLRLRLWDSFVQLDLVKCLFVFFAGVRHEVSHRLFLVRPYSLGVIRFRTLFPLFKNSTTLQTPLSSGSCLKAFWEMCRKSNWSWKWDSKLRQSRYSNIINFLSWQLFWEAHMQT